MEESINEWGKVIVIGTPAQLPLPTPLLKLFATSQPFRPAFPHNLAVSKEKSKLSQSLSFFSFSKGLWREPQALRVRTDSLAVNYSHPRVIEYPKPQVEVHQNHKPFVPVLLLTAVS